MMFLILCFQAILAPENMLQRIDRHVWLALPTFSFFFVCRLHIWLLLIFYIYFTLIVSEKNITVNFISISFKFPMMWLAMG